MKNRFLLILGVCLIAPFYQINAQDDLLGMIEDNPSSTINYAFGTFKGTRIINGHSIETRKKNALEFLISHRFGPVNEGGYALWGLDEANIRLGLEYALTDNLQIAIGRSSFEKTFDGYVKAKLLKQSSGAKNVPVSVVWLSSMIANSLKPREGDKLEFSDRLAYNHQLIIARKFSPVFSFQLMPTYVHYNAVAEDSDDNDIYALGAGARVKLTPSIALNVEYYHRFNKWATIETYDPVSIGFDIETGGHVFQLHFTNARVINEPSFIVRTTDDFFAGGIRFGFNISRTFQLGQGKGKEKW